MPSITATGNLLRGMTPDLSLNDQLSHTSVNILLKRLQAEAGLAAIFHEGRNKNGLKHYG